MSNDYYNDYRNELSRNTRHFFQENNHIMLEKDYQKFNSFSEIEIWGDFEDYDYESWLEEL